MGGITSGVGLFSGIDSASLIDQLIASVPALLRAELGLIQCNLQVLPHRELSEHTGFLGQVPEAETGPLRHRQRRHIAAIHQNSTAVRAQQTDHEAERCGFAGTIGTQ